VTRSPGGEKQQWIFFADRIGLFDFAEKIRSVSELGFKIYAYFLSDLIAATLDSWADGGLDVPRIGTKATAISVPCGFTGAGLPIGLQIAGPPWSEAAVLRLAYAYEQATTWHKREPSCASRL